jgi:hypothetical protein
MDMSDPIVEKSLVQKDYTECHYGGEREWILCQRCEKRCLVLYYLWDQFVCRKCGGLLYEKQTMDSRQRAMERLFVTRVLLLRKGKAIRRPFYEGKLTNRATRIYNRLSSIQSTFGIVKQMIENRNQGMYDYNFKEPFTDGKHKY